MSNEKVGSATITLSGDVMMGKNLYLKTEYGPVNLRGKGFQDLLQSAMQPVTGVEPEPEPEPEKESEPKKKGLFSFLFEESPDE